MSNRHWLEDELEDISHEKLAEISQHKCELLSDWVDLRTALSILVKLCGRNVETVVEQLGNGTEAGTVAWKAPGQPHPDTWQHHQSLSRLLRDDLEKYGAAAAKELQALRIGHWYFDGHRINLPDLLRWARYVPPAEKPKGGRPADPRRDAVIRELVEKLDDRGIDLESASAEEERLAHEAAARHPGETLARSTARDWVTEAKRRLAAGRALSDGTPAA